MRMEEVEILCNNVKLGIRDVNLRCCYDNMIVEKGNIVLELHSYTNNSSSAPDDIKIMSIANIRKFISDLEKGTEVENEVVSNSFEVVEDFRVYNPAGVQFLCVICNGSLRGETVGILDSQPILHMDEGCVGELVKCLENVYNNQDVMKQNL